MKQDVSSFSCGNKDKKITELLIRIPYGKIRSMRSPTEKHHAVV
jgi:hypothetical protein